ncbi:DUF1566 domain-containing protein [Chromobacterium haemolyticum]|uniref:DUF1566 domain-containing protein n=1 Tax=Chromobacterium haemolyticum TaxID=394935 RepID=UPI0005945156|nr:DUF1566 domain-containing protein [Chromobacterium haemolyticum]
MENFEAKLGEAFGGGFYVGRFHVGSAEYALIVAPKSAGETKGTWVEHGVEIHAARSCCDGAANTMAMADAGSELASLIAGLEINGLRDWYLPSRDELEMCYRNLKPTSDENYCTFRDGDNASSIPVGYPYTEQEPAQTTVNVFMAGGAEAFDPAWYWSSTQYSRHGAYVQDFNGGDQYDDAKLITLRARAVRRVLISN